MHIGSPPRCASASSPDLGPASSAMAANHRKLPCLSGLNGRKPPPPMLGEREVVNDLAELLSVAKERS